MNSKIYLGDCLQVMESFDDQYFDMIFADLPYGITKNEWDEKIDIRKFFRQAIRVCRGPIVMTATQPFTSLLVTQMSQSLRHHWIWEKGNATGHLNANNSPMRAHEDIVVFQFTGKIKYNPQKTTGHKRKVSTASHKRNSLISSNYNSYGATTYDSTERFPRSVVKFSSDKQKSKLHPTQKPLALVEYFIKTYTDPIARVLDPTAGAFTTAIACMNTDREYHCIEKDPVMFEIGKKRIGSPINTGER